MNLDLSGKHEKIRLYTEKCEQINIKYMKYLEKYVEQLILKDMKREVDEKRLDLTIRMATKKLLGKDISKERSQYRDLKEPELKLVPSGLETINRVIATKLAIRGWKKQTHMKN